MLPYNASATIREDLQLYPALAAKTTELYVTFYYQNWLKYQAVVGPYKVHSPVCVLAIGTSLTAIDRTRTATLFYQCHILYQQDFPALRWTTLDS